MLVHTKELTLRVRANEKVVASVSLLGVIACTFIGAGYFAPKAEACSPPLDGSEFTCPPWDGVLVREFEETITDQSFEDEIDQNAFDHNKLEVTLFDTRVAHMGHSFPTGEWIEKIRNHEAQQDRISIEEMLNNTLTEYEHGSNDPTKQEVLLQLPSDGD